MSKLQVAEFLTLDGVMEAPEQWNGPFLNEEMGMEIGSNRMADRFNSIPKFVVSTTLQEATWNNSKLIKGNIAEEVSRLKQQFSQAITILGSGDLVHTLMDHHLIDEYLLLVCPLVLGKGKRLFQDASRTTLRLVNSKAYTTSAIWLTYHPA